MSQAIELLPDSLANQIAAGEVVQRPASVVKELMENALDAGAQNIQVIVKEAGKQLIQVIDDGHGMAEADLRLAFERHATSKIKKADDLQSIHTMGFRGEALASIAAIAQVEAKSKTAEAELGSYLVVEGAEVKTQEPVSCKAGTAIAVKNLFFNTPARKHFLKSHNVEHRHIIEEFTHVALAYPNLTFTLKNGQETVYHLKPGSQRQRIVGILGRKYEEGLVPVSESTQLFNISGFIGKPELARKTRGEQYFFVNNRYIRSPYLHHAVVKAFEGLLPDGHHPVYILNFSMPAEKLDVNIHPTKTEVRFQDEQSLYAVLKPAIKRALSQHHIAPSLDFERNPLEDPDFQESQRSRLAVDKPESGGHSASGSNQGESFVKPPGQGKASQQDWEALYKVLSDDTPTGNGPEQAENNGNAFLWDAKTDQELQQSFLILQNQYIISPIQSGLLIIHQQYARQRIAYESYMETLKAQMAYSQQQLFPEVLELSKADKQLLDDLLPDIRLLGFDIEPFGKQAYLVNGVPADLEGANIQDTVEQLLEDYKHQQRYAQLDRKENLARSLAYHAGRQTKIQHSTEALHRLVDQLFACEIPYYTPDGRPVFIKISQQELDKKFDKP